MNDPTDIRRRYRQFADRECKGYSDLYYGLALAHPHGAELTWL